MVAVLAELVEVAKGWVVVVVVAGPPEAVMVVDNCRFATLDELVMAVVEWVMVVVAPVGVEVVVRGRGVEMAEDPPEDFVDVRD